LSETLRLGLEKAEKFAFELYTAAGLEPEKAATVARLQVLTDGLGRSTHGLAMAPLYLAEIAKGEMSKQGQPDIVRDFGEGVTAVWDGNYLPGLWLVDLAIGKLMPRARQFGMAAMAIRKSHHIGCLAALAKGAADEGLIVQIHNSDPAGQRVAPYGGRKALLSPNPYAFAYPGEHHPVLIDQCASITTTSMTRQKVAAGEEFPEPWMLDAQGQPSTDPRVLEHGEPRGSIQLVGGASYGHKGFGLSLATEALSQGLSGHGRFDAPKRWGSNVFVQLIDPAHFAGLDAFHSQMDDLAKRCRSNPPIDPAQPVRLPGDQAAKRLAAAQAQGIELPQSTWGALCAWADQLKVSVPTF
jgi:LDH2 family malate/lactate/ureidoglycolate dehydrogenase